MRLLLDTHTVLWWLDSPGKLGKTGHSLIADPNNEVMISPVVPWEIAIKANKYKAIPHALVPDFLNVMRKQDLSRSKLHRSKPFVPGCCRSIIAIRSTVC